MSGGPTYGKNPPTDRLAFGLKSSQHWQSWSEMQEQWRFAEETGWDSAWAFDHFFSLTDGELGETLDGWTILAGVAQMTTRIQLGLMVTGVTHRPPAVLFKQAVSVDHISAGRLILSMGASWNEREHEAYGIEFPSAKVRVDRFAEAMEMYRMLETQERTTYNGKHYRLVEAPFEPKPVFGHIPILIGSTGKRMLRYVAAYADQWDGRAQTPEEYRANGARLIKHCQAIGRDAADIRWVRHSGKEELDKVANEDVFRTHVEDYVRIGVRSFILSIPKGSPSPALRNIAEKVIPEMRERFAAGTLTA